MFYLFNINGITECGLTQPSRHSSVYQYVRQQFSLLFYFIPLHAHHSLFTCFAVVDN